jgi:hypothetical protein
MGNYAGAVADYDQSLKLKPDSPGAYDGRKRVQALLTANQPGAATVQAQLPTKTSPPQPVISWAAIANRPKFPIFTGQRVALVIGNSGYTSSIAPALPNPRRDAKLVADALRQDGFETVVLTDLDHVGMVKALQAFRDKADSADWALIYFAGHGIAIDGMNYLLPIDAKLADSRDVGLKLFPMRRC